MLLGEPGSAPKLQYCLINFQRGDDLEEFEKEFNNAIDDLKSQKK